MSYSNTAHIKGGSGVYIKQVGKRRTIIIPPEICNEVGLQEGDFVEFQAVNGTVVIKPKKVVDIEESTGQEFSTPALWILL